MKNFLKGIKKILEYLVSFTMFFILAYTVMWVLIIIVSPIIATVLAGVTLSTEYYSLTYNFLKDAVEVIHGVLFVLSTIIAFAISTDS